MEIINYRNWVIEFDHEKTKQMYSLIARGSSEECNCEECQNFRIVGGRYAVRCCGWSG